MANRLACDRLRRLRLLVEAAHALGDHDPGLLASCPGVDHRLEPGRVVERARLDVQRRRHRGGLVIDAGSAARAERAAHRIPAVGLSLERPGLAGGHAERVFGNDETHAEGAPGLALTLGAVAHGQCDRGADHAVAQRAALAAAFSRLFHDAPPDGRPDGSRTRPRLSGE